MLQKYVGQLPVTQALSLEQISDLIDAMEEEYKQFLVRLWEQVKHSDSRSLDDILDKRYNRVVLSFEYASEIRKSHAAAEEITVWEQITRSNDRDIEALNALVRTYATDLLAHITLDFMEDI